MQGVCDHLGQWCHQNMLVLNCDKNKTEAMILETECHHNINPTQLKIDGKEILYVEYTKVLGIFIDKGLSFKHHATEKLKHCKQIWNLIKRGTTRDRGLNTRSLTYILKVVVLTKLLYGSMIWLHKNLDTFNSFWNDIILKCSGSMYYPHREVTEIALQLPPLDVQLEVITVKFLCKCLSGNNFMNSVVLQVDGSLHNILHDHMRSLKNFLAWKKGIRSARNIDLTAFSNSNEVCYSKEEMIRYTSHLWLVRAKNICLIKKRNSRGDQLILKAASIPTAAVTKKSYIFRYNTTRYMDTRIMEFIHGSSDRFQNFYQSRLGNTLVQDLCNYCETGKDSPSHQLFDCIALEDHYRRELERLIDSKEDYLHHLLIDGNEIIHRLFYKRVEFIDSINLDP